MGLFGTSLFEKKKPNKLYDFAQHGILRGSEDYGMVYVQELTQEVEPGGKKKATPKKKEAPKPTPKELFVLKSLNRPDLEIKTDAAYLDTEIKTLERKLELYPEKPRKKKKGNRIEDQLMGYGESGATMYGRLEVESMIERLKARRKYSVLQSTVNKYPHTTSDAIRELLHNHKHLEARPVEPTLPDLPAEAVEAMHEYADLTKAATGKLPVFYLIKEKQDEREVQRKRDPILLAQSPFGFVWQILGAWDKEVVLLDEL